MDEQELRNREQELPQEAREAFQNFRYNLVEYYRIRDAWAKAFGDIRMALPPSSRQRKAINRIAQILTVRRGKLIRLGWRDPKAAVAYLENLLHDILDILEEAWSEDS